MNFRRQSQVFGVALVAAAAALLAFSRHREHVAQPANPAAIVEATVGDPGTAPPADVATSELVGSPGAASVSPAPVAPAMDEPALMTLLRSANGNDPTLAVELAREGNRRFPESADATERTSILIHALAELGQSSEARGEAERMVNHYPDSSWVREVEAFTGAHRHRNVVLDDQGRLRFVDPPAELNAPAAALRAIRRT